MADKEIREAFLKHLQDTGISAAEMLDTIDSSYDRGDFITKIAEINVGKSKLVLTPMVLKRMLSVFLEDMVESMKFACEMANRMTEMKEKKEQKMREVMMQVDNTVN